MRPIPAARMATAVAVSALAGAMLFSAPQVSAAPADSDRPDRARGAFGDARDVAKDLGGKSVGIYRDADSGRMVVTATGRAAAAEVREAGEVARVVEHSKAELAGAIGALERVRRSPAPHGQRTR